MKNLLKISLLLITFSLNAQEFSGKVEYFYSRDVRNKKQRMDSLAKTDDNFKDFYKEMVKANQAEYTMIFNKNEALTTRNEKVESDLDEEKETNIKVITSNDNPYYINLKENYFLEEKTIFDKEVLYKNELPKYEWTILADTKSIYGFNCTKAELIVKPTAEALENYKKDMEAFEKDPKKFFRTPSEPSNAVFTAWFCIDIPVSLGPNRMTGLPGLILELTNDKITFVATKVEINKKSTIEIKKPKRGKLINEEQHKKLLEKEAAAYRESGGIIMTNSTTTKN